MNAHLVNVDSIWPKAIELAGNLFATPVQLFRMRSLQIQMLESGARNADRTRQSLLTVKLEDDETILVELVQAMEGQPVVGGHWMQLSISAEGVVAMATGPSGSVTTDPPGYN